ncbi:unnamed protein product, partial [Arabidopsis halleri]
HPEINISTLTNDIPLKWNWVRSEPNLYWKGCKLVEQ